VICRILKSATMPGGGTFQPGAVVNLPKDVADNWMAQGIARFHDGSPFVKGEVYPKPKRKNKKMKTQPKNKMETPPENKVEEQEVTTESAEVEPLAKDKPKKERNKTGR